MSKIAAISEMPAGIRKGKFYRKFTPKLVKAFVSIGSLVGIFGALCFAAAGSVLTFSFFKDVMAEAGLKADATTAVTCFALAAVTLVLSLVTWIAKSRTTSIVSFALWALVLAGALISKLNVGVSLIMAVGTLLAVIGTIIFKARWKKYKKVSAEAAAKPEAVEEAPAEEAAPAIEEAAPVAEEAAEEVTEEAAEVAEEAAEEVTEEAAEVAEEAAEEVTEEAAEVAEEAAEEAAEAAAE